VVLVFFFQAEDGIRDRNVTGVQTCALPISLPDAPVVGGATTTLEDTQSGLITVDRNAADGSEVTHFKITGITGGSLFLADGITRSEERRVGKECRSRGSREQGHRRNGALCR